MNQIFYLDASSFWILMISPVTTRRLIGVPQTQQTYGALVIPQGCIHKVIIISSWKRGIYLRGQHSRWLIVMMYPIFREKSGHQTRLFLYLDSSVVKMSFSFEGFLQLACPSKLPFRTRLKLPFHTKMFNVGEICTIFKGLGNKQQTLVQNVHLPSLNWKHSAPATIPDSQFSQVCCTICTSNTRIRKHEGAW